MAHYNFVRDLEDSKKGVAIVGSYFANKYNAAIRTLGKSEQAYGDILVERDKDLGGQFYVEVKLDIMAARTGNLCFEVDNGKKTTGILATKADIVVYAVPLAGKFKLFIFDVKKLLSYLTDVSHSSKMKMVRGGDKGKFGMILVKADVIELDKICEEIVECQTTTISASPVIN